MLSHGFLLVPLLALARLATAQDQCNLLPLRGHVNVPLYSLVEHTLTPTNTTICDKYAPKNSTQLHWITRLINQAFIGNFKPLPGPHWPEDPNGTYQSTGILDPLGKYRDPCQKVYDINLLQYFNGSLRSTNRNGKAVAINLLDGGSVPALRENMPAWDSQSNQYKMMTGFYQYFGYFLGCTDGSIPRYNGSASQTSIHRFMDLPSPYVHYFIHNIADAATSLGVRGDDIVTHVGDSISIGIALDNIFNKRCSPPEKVVGYQPTALQSLCGDAATCAPWTYPNATCTAYNLTNYGVTPAHAQSGGAKPQYCPSYPPRRHLT